MKTRKSLFVSAAAVAALVAFYPARSEAGYSFGAYSPYCYKGADGSGYCFASLAGMRANSDPSAYAGFSASFSGPDVQYGSFYAGLNGTYYSCYVPSTAPIRERWLEFAYHAGSQPFFVSWGADGICNLGAVNPVSYYP